MSLEPLLFQRYPGLDGRLPRVALARLPTPVERLPAAAVPGAASAEPWVKRDDLTGEPYGGNKVRKLEFLLGAAQAAGVERLITIGAAGSHHALATAVFGRRLGFEVTLVLCPQPRTPHVRDVILMDHALGAELRWAPRMELLPAALMAARLAHRGERVAVIPAGGSDPVGAIGYVEAGLELGRQVDDGELPEPDSIHLPAGTLGTLAGLAVGCALAGLSSRLVGVRVVSRLVAHERALRKLVRGTLRRLERAGVGDAPDPGAVLSRIELRHDLVGGGYGVASEEGEEASRAFEASGLTLDPTYTAKAAAAFREEAARSGEGVRLYLHTLSGVEPRHLLERASPQALPEPFRSYVAAI